MLDGLHLYEIVLGALGVVAFLMILVLVVRQVWQSKPYGKLLSGLVLPCVMIAWPGIQSIQVGKDTISISKNTEALRENPNDAKARQELSKTVEQVKDRPISDPAAATSIAEAQFELGDPKAAEAAADKVLKSDPSSTGALSLKRRIQIFRKLPELTAALENHPDPQKQAELDAATKEALAAKTANSELLKHIARAQQVTKQATAQMRATSVRAIKQTSSGANSPNIVNNGNGAINFNNDLRNSKLREKQ